MSANRGDRNTPAGDEIRAVFPTGRKLLPVWFKFGISACKYTLLKKKYPLFSLKSLKLLANKSLLPSKKFVKFAGRYYTGLLGVPAYPSSAFDHMAAEGGLNFLDAGTPLKSRIDSAILGISRKCRNNCSHCYECENLSQQESVPLSRWKEVVRELQEEGVNIIVFSGGEPMLRYDDLIELVEAGDKSRSDFHVHSGGHGVTFEKAVALRAAGLDSAAIGMDDIDPSIHNRIRGSDNSFSEVVAAFDHFRRAGVFTYANVCLRKEQVSNNNLLKLYRGLKDMQVGAVLLLEPKPYGKFFHEEGDTLFCDADREIVTDFFLTANRHRKYEDYPLVSYMAYFERPGRFGCNMGGLSHLYINSAGDVQPCIFLSVSFGSIMKEPFPAIYRRMREAVPFPLHKQCPSILLSSIIKEKQSRGIEMPVPFRHIEKEWRPLFE